MQLLGFLLLTCAFQLCRVHVSVRKTRNNADWNPSSSHKTFAYTTHLLMNPTTLCFCLLWATDPYSKAKIPNVFKFKYSTSR